MEGQVRINIEDCASLEQSAKLVKLCEELSNLGLDVIMYSNIKVSGKEFIIIDDALRENRTISNL